MASAVTSSFMRIGVSFHFISGSARNFAHRAKETPFLSHPKKEIKKPSNN
jgi:hypothetical protein